MKKKDYKTFFTARGTLGPGRVKTAPTNTSPGLLGETREIARDKG